MDYQEYLHWTYFGDEGDEGFDAAEFERMGELFAGTDVFIDVGASHGVYTFHALHHMKTGSVIAIEADPDRFAILRDNVAKWSEESPLDIECRQAAVSDERDQRDGGTITFYTTGTQISGGLFPVGERSDAYQPIEIPVVTLDEIVPSTGRVLVKIDVEGGELRVLQGASELIRSGRARFFVELSWWGDRDRGTSIWSTLRYIRKSGLGMERRLRSDYLLSSEPSRVARWWQQAKVLPALLPRYLFNRVTPYSIRKRLIRHQNQERLQRASAPTGE